MHNSTRRISMPRLKWTSAVAVITTMALVLAGGASAFAGKRGLPTSSKGLGVAGAPGQQTTLDGGSSAEDGPANYIASSGELSQPTYPQIVTTSQKVTTFDGEKIYIEIT